MYSVRDIKTLDDLDNTSNYSARGFNMNDRVNIKEDNHEIDIIEFLDAAYEQDLIVLEKVDV